MQRLSGLQRAITARWSTRQRLTTRSRPLRGCGGFGHRTWTDCTRTGGCHGGSSMRATGIATCIIADVSDCRSWRAMAKGRQVERLAMACHRSEEHTSELKSLMRISYAVFCLQKHILDQKSTTLKSTHQYK